MKNPTRKTILFYTDTPYAGGAENQMYLLAKFLDKEKYEVKLICSNYKSLGDWAARFESEGIEVVKLNVFHKHDPRHYVQLKEYIKRKKRRPRIEPGLIYSTTTQKRYGKQIK